MVYSLYPRVSVVVPFYDMERYLAQTIRSVLQQSYTSFELLLIDDGSQDRSVAICQSFSDPRIRVFRQSNQGPAAARNLGIRQSRGELIAFLDGDDLWHPDKLARHVAHLDANPRVGVSFCRSQLIDEFDRPLHLHQMAKLEGIELLDLLCRTPIGNGSVPVIRKQIFAQIETAGGSSAKSLGSGFYFNPSRELHPSEDVECWLRIMLLTPWQFEGIAESLTLYRVNSRGCSANLLKKLDSWQVMLAQMGQYAPGVLRVCQKPAMAYQLRHLARRAVSLRDGDMAVHLSHRALRQYPKIVLEEPGRTLQTLAAAYVMVLAPRWLYETMEGLARQWVGRYQRWKTSQVKALPRSTASAAAGVFPASGVQVQRSEALTHKA
jgi:hypothetical protein